MGLLGIYHYWVFVLLLMIGFYAIIAKVNLIKKLIGLSIFQSAVFLLYITMSKVIGGTAPIYAEAAGRAVLKSVAAGSDSNRHCCGYFNHCRGPRHR